QSIFFLRSFQRLHFGVVGRKASKPFCSSCSRTTCSWRERVQIAYQSAPGVTVRSVTGLRRRDVLLVELLQLRVLPLDERLRPHAGEKLAHLGLLARLVDTIGDQVAHAVERLDR